ncbi:MAG: BamA/TamA family outer membrane protein, partial [Planctomycetota bacterium]|nr:BamA/TamA family outer membrane protein [Planctomycetota bacterium]
VDTRRSRGESGAYVTEVVVRREGAPIREPVEVEVRTFLGRSWRGRWDGKGTAGTVRIESEVPTWSSRIDPRKRLRETTRVDNQSPPSFKFLLNRFRVKIDLNGRDHEASIGSTIVLNNDYRNRYFLTLFSTEEQDGGMLGYQRSFGAAIDPTRYRQSLGLALSITELDPDFASRSSGRLNDEGQVTPLHASYRISTFQSSRNPLSGFSFGIGGEYAEKVFGSDFRYWKAAMSGEVVFPLIRDRHILALRGTLGAIQREGAPTQLLYDVGGFSGVRGIRSGEFLGHYQWIAKAEYRFVILDHLRLHILTLGWLRRVQIAAFVEAGNVSDRTNELFRGEDTLIGAGMGVRFHIDLFGINPTVWRFDVGKRIDDYDADTFLFYLGAGQSF